eukprot:GFUD01015102.1.p1 GENE.GFUD01015102.1~~GFUD01015102.1.p1  ORF type:complete len:708 (+),score=267.32 GFUD01015102.1:178-2301(+)
MTSVSSTMSQFVFPDDQPVVKLDAATAFSMLTTSEQLYSHYLSRASWWGGLVVLLQTSQESPDIFRLVQRVNTAEDVASMRTTALATGLTEQEVTAYLVFCAGFYGNMGNYKGFGDSKFVPNLAVDRLELLVKNCKAYKDSPVEMEELWKMVKGPLYSLTDKEKQLGLGEKGVTKYFTPNCDMTDSEMVNRFMKSKNMEGYINRVIKTMEGGKVVYEIRHAGVEEKELSREEFEDCTFKVTVGDYNELLEKVSENLDMAVKHVANSDEKDMLVQYAKSFREGSLDRHKDGSRFWIKNKGPIVETYIGFIETYRDPAGMRGEFEGFVSMVNKEMSAKFQVLVDRAEEMLPALPWPKEFEKDTFLRPDFTSLDVLTFAGSGVPAGINIPNYDEIRQEEGFKNVSLGNVLSASYGVSKPAPFLSSSDNDILKLWKVASFEVQVGLHELLGHGSGKLFHAGNFPAGLTCPVGGGEVGCYGQGDTYDSVFTTIGSSYEECRAECVGLHLCLEPGVTEIFGHSGQQAEDIKYANWVSMVLAGVKGLEMFSPTSQEWKQAHSQARFVIMQIMLEAGEDFLTIKELVGEDGKPDLLITMDREKVLTVGQPAIAAFLLKLQVYKSTGDIAAAKEMFDKYSEVSEPWASRRQVVVDRKQPRPILVQSNTILEEEKLKLMDYDPSPEGMVKSWAERFPDPTLDTILTKLAAKDRLLWA